MSNVNCWQYSRDVYLVGRSWKFRPFTEDERTAVIAFITAMAATRPAYVPYINLKAGNPPANTIDGETLFWGRLEKQNDETLGKMVQKIGRSLKVQFCTEEEKELCDALFIATDQRRQKTLSKYADVVNNEVEPEESSSEAPEESSSEAPEESSSEAPEESSSSEG